jgi:hypothetical protein
MIIGPDQMDCELLADFQKVCQPMPPIDGAVVVQTIRCYLTLPNLKTTKVVLPMNLGVSCCSRSAPASTQGND